MYNYIFWVIYTRNINRNKGEWLSRHNASGIVFFAILIHTLLFLEISGKWFNSKINLEYLMTNKAFSVLGVLLCIFSIYLYYTKKRITKIENKYCHNKSIEKLNNNWIVLFIIFIPLLTVMIIGKK